jgi:pentatricopeptide repeat protein
VNKMVEEGNFPDKFLCSSIMSACASAGAQERGKEMHFFAVMNGYESDQAVGNATINMYAKFGSRADAYRVFQRMTKQDIVSWSAIIAAYAQHGCGQYAVDLYNRMLDEGVSTDKVSLIHLLSACSHDGLLDEALRQFTSVMQEDCGIIIIDHFNCMVDLLGRAGRLEEAEKLLLRLPFKHSAVAWTTLLGACRSQVDLARGEKAANRVFELDPEATAPYVTLSNLYFSAGRVDDALNVIRRMRAKGLVKHTDGVYFEVLGETVRNG